jgi:hypothetical protein
MPSETANTRTIPKLDNKLPGQENYAEWILSIEMFLTMYEIDEYTLRGDTGCTSIFLSSIQNWHCNKLFIWISMLPLHKQTKSSSFFVNLFVFSSTYRNLKGHET